MKFSVLVALLACLEGAFGPVTPEQVTEFQEDCCGAAMLSNAALVWGLRAQRRDVF